jgi:hypothetical protein
MLVQFLGGYIMWIRAVFPKFRRYMLLPFSRTILNREASVPLKRRQHYSHPHSVATQELKYHICSIWRYVGVREETSLGPTRQIPGFGQSGFQPSFTSDKPIQRFRHGLYRAASESMTWNRNNTQAIVEGFTFNISTLCGKDCVQCRKERLTHEGWLLE